MRQVTHALLTRPPLDWKVQALSSPVRLACVKHAASVHPEPGSNSHYKVLSLVSNKRKLIFQPFTVLGLLNRS